MKSNQIKNHKPIYLALALVLGFTACSNQEEVKSKLSSQEVYISEKVAVEPSTGIATVYAVVSVIAKANLVDMDLMRSFVKYTEGPVKSGMLTTEVVSDEFTFEGDPSQKSFINNYYIGRKEKGSTNIKVLFINEQIKWDTSKNKYISSFSVVTIYTNPSDWDFNEKDYYLEGNGDISKFYKNGRVANDFLLALANNPKPVAKILKGKDLSEHGVVRGDIIYDEEGQPATYVINGLANLNSDAKSRAKKELQDVMDSSREGSIVISTEEGDTPDEINYDIRIQAGAFSDIN